MSVTLNSILLATDGSPDASIAAKAAVDLSNQSGAELHVVHVGRSLSAYARPATMPKEYSLFFAQEAEELLEEQSQSIRHAGGEIAHAHMRFGRPADEILKLAEDLGAGLVVLGSRGVGPVERLVMGSVSEDVVHNTHRPVLVTRGNEESWPPASIVLGDDTSLEATEAGELAASIGRLFGAEGHVVHAYPTLPRISEDEDTFDARIVEEAFRQAEKALEERGALLESSLGRPLEVKSGSGRCDSAHPGRCSRGEIPSPHRGRQPGTRCRRACKERVLEARKRLDEDRQGSAWSCSRLPAPMNAYLRR
jgi:nucleotide-binding universal stress UspA family protein